MEKNNVQPSECTIPSKELLKLVRLHFIEKKPTEEIMKQLKTKEEREHLALIATLDVDEKKLLHMVERNEPEKLHNLLACRFKTKEVIKEYKKKNHQEKPLA